MSARARTIALTGAILTLGLAVAPMALGRDAALSAIRPAVDAEIDGLRWVRTAQLAQWMADDRDRPLVLLDTRPVAEFDVSHLPGARRVDPTTRDTAALGIPPRARVVVYCSVGWRSGHVARRLLDAGRGRTWNLEGGLFAWANEGRPMVDASGNATARVHPFDAAWGRLLRPELRAPLP